MDALQFIEVVSNFGIIGVISVFLWLFMTGKILSRQVVDELIKATVKDLVHELRQDIGEMIREEVTKAHDSR